MAAEQVAATVEQFCNSNHQFSVDLTAGRPVWTAHSGMSLDGNWQRTVVQERSSYRPEHPVVQLLP